MPDSNRRSFVLGAAATWAGTSAGWASRAESDPAPLIAAERKRILDAMAKADVPGAAVCFIHDGKPVWVEGFGVTDTRAGRPVAADTIFSIQSTSKNVTATAIMLAVQQGLLDLDRPITSYLPDFTVQSRFERAPQEKMNLRLLMAHRAGFTHEAPVGNNYDPAFPSFEAHIASIAQTWLRFPVGERYRYSNLGFDLAGYILQKQSRMAFADFVKTMVFDPLGMKDSTVATDVYAARANRAVGHDKGYASVPLKTPLIPSGGVYTSARDMAAYALFHLNRGKVGGRAVLKEELWNEMHAFPYGDDYSLGVIRSELRYGAADIRLLSHRGGGFGFGSVFDYCPEAGLAWVAMFNRPASAAYRFGEKLVDDAFAARYGAKKPRQPIDGLATVTLPATSLPNYIGNYVGRNGNVDIEIRNGTLGMEDGTSFTPIRFLSPDQLCIAGPDGDAVRYRYAPATSLEPAHLECWVGENSLDYNESAKDVPGPNKPAWARYVGTYRITQWGKPADTVTIALKNGYLHLDKIRLIVEFEPGLFFTSDGEAIDFRQTPPTWKNIRLQRVS